MSAWQIWRDGEWLVSEIGDNWARGDTFATEEEAVEELRRLQMHDLLSAETDLKMIKEKIEKYRTRLKAAPKVSRLATPRRSEDTKTKA